MKQKTKQQTWITKLNINNYPISTCKVVISNYVFRWLLFHAKFDCNYIQSFVPCIYHGIYL